MILVDHAVCGRWYLGLSDCRTSRLVANQEMRNVATGTLEAVNFSMVQINIDGKLPSRIKLCYPKLVHAIQSLAIVVLESRGFNSSSSPCCPGGAFCRWQCRPSPLCMNRLKLFHSAGLRRLKLLAVITPYNYRSPCKLLAPSAFHSANVPGNIRTLTSSRHC